MRTADEIAQDVAYTGCRICPSADGGWVERLVVNVEETGVLHESWATEADQQ